MEGVCPNLSMVIFITTKYLEKSKLKTENEIIVIMKKAFDTCFLENKYQKVTFKQFPNLMKIT